MGSEMCIRDSALTIAANVNAQTVVTTDFSVLDGFTIGGTDDVVLNELVTFSGGQQQLSFLSAAYNSGPDGFLFINGTDGFNGASSTGDIGNILFGGGGATAVSFHAANLANGDATSFTSFDANGNELQSLLTQVDTLRGPNDADEILSFTAIGGQNIARIEIDLPGPAFPVGQPSAAAIDTFSATVAPAAAAVPEPSSFVLLSLAASCGFLRRRR